MRDKKNKIEIQLESEGPLTFEELESAFNSMEDHEIGEKFKINSKVAQFVPSDKEDEKTE